MYMIVVTWNLKCDFKMIWVKVCIVKFTSSGGRQSHRWQNHFFFVIKSTTLGKSTNVINYFLSSLMLASANIQTTVRVKVRKSQKHFFLGLQSGNIVSEIFLTFKVLPKKDCSTIFLLVVQANRGPLKVLNYTKLILNNQRDHLQL